MSSWYKKAMPTVKNVLPHINDIASEVKGLPGVESVWVWGSFFQHASQPDYVIKDVDIIAKTSFDSGDLMAVDDGKYSPLSMNPKDLEDEGFNAKSVAFTKKYLTVKKCNVDHWVISADNKLLHWGLIPESIEDWEESHREAEQFATKMSNVSRDNLVRASEDKKEEWQAAYIKYTRKYCGGRNSPMGWYKSKEPVENIMQRAKRIG